MNSLILGIDAADLVTFQKLDLPFINSLLNKGTNLNLKLDLFSRGWSEILYGTNGRNLRALYKYPILDGSHKSTGVFRTPEEDDLLRVSALWKEFSKKNLSVGLLNVPGTFPAPKIDKGFIVSGAGGGSPNDGKALVDEQVCSSEKVFEVVKNSGYVGDVRFSKRRFESHEIFFKSLMEHDKSIASTYLKLVKEFNPSIGFVVFTAFNRLSGVYRWHLENPNKNNNIDKLIKNYMLSFDKTIEKLFNSIKPDSFILTSDHGHTPRLYDFNINKLLQNNNFQIVNSKKLNFKNKIKLYLINSIKKSVDKNLIKKISSKLSKKYIGDLKDARNNLNINWSNSKAFGFRHIPGIYINDKRFDGLITEEEKPKFIEKIIKTLNNNPELKEHKIIFEHYKSEYECFKYSNYLPDIWINLPKGYFPVEEGDKVMNTNENYNPINDLRKVKEDMNAAIKSTTPLACVSSLFSNQLKQNDFPNDLTAINILIRSINKS
tara:strand:+ start:8980 stop:10449 length:1470 start_codon:yes stop_codon:yes gene_type:complete